MLTPAKAVILACALAGCATAKYGSQDYLYIVSEPQGAHVTTNIGKSCVAPCTLVLPRKSKFQVSMDMAGYQSWTGEVTNLSRGEIAKQHAAANAATKAGAVAGGAAIGATSGALAAGASGQLGLTLGGGVGATAGGAGLIMGGVILGAAAPMAVDSATGANRALWPNPLHVRLAPLPPQDVQREPHQ